MNNTNRALNRALLFLIGLVLVAIGGAVATAAAWPAAGQTWESGLAGVQSWAEGLWESTVIAGTQLTWIAVAALAAIVLLIVVLLVIVVRGIRGRRRTPLRSTGSQSDAGRITVTEGFASDALKDALSARTDILSAKVTANEIAREPVLHVSVTPRQNASPLAVARDVERLVGNLEALTGTPLTTFISVHSGLRARLAHDQRRLS